MTPPLPASSVSSASLSHRGHVLVVDPAVRRPEIECYNLLVQKSPLPCTYHLPALLGMNSLRLVPMESARGIIILGSASSVHDRLPWQIALEEWLLPHLQRSIPTLGICYGHQMLAAMFGGSVGYVNTARTKQIGLRAVTITDPPVWVEPLADFGAMRPIQGNVVVSHAETVCTVPASMAIFAHSPTVPTEALAHRSFPIWSFQSHPEATATSAADYGAILPSGERDLDFGHRLVGGFLRWLAQRHSAAGTA